MSPRNRGLGSSSENLELASGAVWSLAQPTILYYSPHPFEGVSRVTLVGEALARAGHKFINDRPCEVASTCPVAKACQNLPWGRSFEVTRIRTVHHDVCTVHEGGVRVVEVDELPIMASLEASKTRGTMAHWSPPVCHIRGCPNWDRCFPLGLTPGGEYELAAVEGKLACPMGYHLVGVVLREIGAPARPR